MKNIFNEHIFGQVTKLFNVHINIKSDLSVVLIDFKGCDFNFKWFRL